MNKSVEQNINVLKSINWFIIDSPARQNVGTKNNKL